MDTNKRFTIVIGISFFFIGGDYLVEYLGDFALVSRRLP